MRGLNLLEKIKQLIANTGWYLFILCNDFTEEEYWTDIYEQEKANLEMCEGLKQTTDNATAILPDVIGSEAECKFKGVCDYDKCVIAICNDFEQKDSEVAVCVRCGKNIELVDNIQCKKCQSETSESKAN